MRRLGLAVVFSTLLVSATEIASLARPDKPGADLRGAQPTPSVQDKIAQSSESIKGRVIGEEGRPVAGVSIMAIPVNIASNRQSMVTTIVSWPVISDADGKFELTGLQAGAYTILARAEGYILSDSDSKQFHRAGESVTLTLVKPGVITGKLTNSLDNPVAGVVVRAIKVREADNKPVRVREQPFSKFANSMNSLLGPFKTDDRGIYRIYGLAPGYYQVAAGGRSWQGFGAYNTGVGPYDGDAPTYYPSSTLPTAGEVAVRAGHEVANIDIRYRDNRGHSVSGTVSGSKGSDQEGISLVLTRATSGVVEKTIAETSASVKEKGFAFDALLDGEYFVTAMVRSGNPLEGAEGYKLSVSPSRRVTVSGADVTGVELVLEPLASIAGRALIEPISAQKAECKATRPARLGEVVISARGEGNEKPEDQSLSLGPMFEDTSPNENGEFTVGFLRPGVHRLDLQLPGDSLYIKTVTLPPLTPDGKPVDAARSGVKLKSGDKVKGLVVTMSEGAAGLRGRVVTGEASKPPTSKMRVHLVPSEPEATEDVLRYVEAEVATNRGFILTNVAPGKYWLIAREISEQEQSESDHKPLAWDAGGRIGLRFEGEATKKVIQLSTCQRVIDLVLSYTPLIRPAETPIKKFAL
ncbi:MAG: carboxypeptidase-like regulatory domain-containing protein [Acidobacteriota bacterium]